MAHYVALLCQLALFLQEAPFLQIFLEIAVNSKISKKNAVPYQSQLGLDKDPFSLHENNNTFFYGCPPLLQNLSIIKKLIQGRDSLILVVGERGSGKTTMLNQFLATSNESWRACHIRIRNRTDGGRQTDLKHLDGRLAYMLKNDRLPVIILDDAHELNTAELHFLFQFAGLSGDARKIKQMVLFCEPQIKTTLARILRGIPRISINRLYMPSLTEEQTTAYILHRLEAAGFKGKNPFTVSHVRAINKSSKGLPGLINEDIRMLLMDKFSKKNHESRLFFSGLGLNVRSSHLMIGGMAALILLVFLLFQNLTVSFFPLRYGFSTAVKTTPLSYSPKPRKREAKICREEWILAQDPSHYTLQIMGVRKETTVLQFIEKYRLQGRVSYYHTYYKSGDWYPLLYGIYSTRELALAKINELHEEISKSLPWVRRLSSVHGEIQKGM